jgi:hypothetical protein
MEGRTMRTTKRPTVHVVWFGGREFQHITWKGTPSITITWAVWKHTGPGVMRAAFMGRREH